MVKTICISRKKRGYLKSGRSIGLRNWILKNDIINTYSTIGALTNRGRFVGTS